MATLSGYSRLRCCNELLPTDIHVFLMKNIGINERIVISDFLIGERGDHNPLLPLKVAQQIKEIQIHDKNRINKQFKKIMKDGIKLLDTHHIIKTLPKIIYIYRYISIHDSFESQSLLKTFIKTGQRLLNELENVKNKGFPRSSPELDYLLNRTPLQWSNQTLQKLHILYKHAKYEMTTCITHLQSILLSFEDDM